MRRFFIILFILSLCATAASLYWRSMTPLSSFASRQVPDTAASRSAPSRSIDGTGGSGGAGGQSRDEGVAPEPRASSGPDLALVISIASSIISAAAALVQTWLTARAFPARRAGE